MHTRLDSDLLDSALARLDRASRRTYRLTAESLLPVHTLRVAADRFGHDSVPRAGSRALHLLQTFAPDCVVLAQALRLPGYEALPTDPGRVDVLLGRLESGDSVHPAAQLAHEVYRRVHRQLTHAPVQDLRIDFHSGYGIRSDDDEDTAAIAAATELTLALRDGMPCPRIGIRIKPLDGAGARRALRTLDLFVSTLVDRGHGTFPEPFLLSIPSVNHPEQVSTAAQIAGTLETRLGLPRGTLRFELGFSEPQVLFDETGGAQLGALVAASSGRCVTVRIDDQAIGRALGSRDPLAAEGMRDLARLALAGSSLPISYGSSPDLPHGGPRRNESGERFAAVHAAWRTHFDAVLRGLRQGFPHGWDHDAGQIPARLAAVTSHFLKVYFTLRGELSEAIALTRASDPPERLMSGQRLMDEVLLGLDCGAILVEDLEGSGLEPEDLVTRSFRIALERRGA